MLKVYINYPNPHITIHSNSSCKRILQQNKENQRVVKINISNLSKELENFENKKHLFGANAEINDIWLYIDLSDSDFEHAVVKYIHKLLSNLYKPFKSASIKRHC